MVKDPGSMFGGHSASKKFGGPEIYAVASRAFMAGEEEGKRIAKNFEANDAVSGASSRFCCDNCFTKSHSY